MSPDSFFNYETSKDALLENLITRSFEVDATDEMSPEIYYEPAMQGYGSVIPLFEEEDIEILLHREAHFASSFPLMLQAYEDEARSALLDVDTSSIERLMLIEEKLGKSLAPLLLQADDAQKIAKVRKMYELLREAIEENKNPELVAISHLILAEDEDLEAIANSVALSGPTIIASLCTLIENDILYDPLWPGYGQAPLIAALALGKLHATSAITSLFSMLQNDTFDIQNAALRALCDIGDEAKRFCIAQLRSRPLSRNNELAALALCSFRCDDDIVGAVSAELRDPISQKHKGITAYLLACVEEFDEASKERLAQDPALLEKVREEIAAMRKK